jgi:hypothetical protein
VATLQEQLDLKESHLVEREEYLANLHARLDAARAQEEQARENMELLKEQVRPFQSLLANLLASPTSSSYAMAANTQHSVKALPPMLVDDTLLADASTSSVDPFTTTAGSLVTRSDNTTTIAVDPLVLPPAVNAEELMRELANKDAHVKTLMLQIQQMLEKGLVAHQERLTMQTQLGARR